MYNLTHTIFDVVYTNHHSFSNGLELVLQATQGSNRDKFRFAIIITVHTKGVP